MKKSLTILLAAGAMAVLGIFTGCNRETIVKPSVAVSNVTAEITSAEVTLNTTKITDYAYLVAPAGVQLSDDPAVIFATGVTGQLTDGENKVVVRGGLEGNTSYSAVFAFKQSEAEFYPELVSVDFTTTDYVETFTLLETYSDGFKIHVKVPQSVKDAGNAVRFNIGSLPFYLSSKNGWFAQLEADMLLQNAQQKFLNDTTILYNSDNIYAYDDDPVWGGEYMLHTPFVPGEPIVFTAGEFAWDDSDFTGWGSGYYLALFDFDAYYESLGGGGDWGPWSVEVDDDFTAAEDDFWTGFYIRKYIQLDPPAQLEAKVDIKADMQAVRGKLTITPDEEVFQYCMLILPESEFDYMMQDINNDESLLQWFTTSYYAAMLWQAQTFQGPMEIALEESLYLEPETTYHLMLTAMGDEYGSTQCFYHETFATTAKTHPAPVMEVKAIDNPSGEESPYEVWFNVKCTSKDAVYAKYAANYEREFGMAFNSGYDYSKLVEMGNSFSAEEMELINSDEGENIRFSTMPGQTTVLAVLGYNDEDTPNTIEGTDDSDPAVAKVKAIYEPAKAPVESSLFKDLLGDWTMSAEISDNVYDSEAGGYVWKPAGTRSCKVSIVEGVSYPETLDESVYATYKELVGMSKDEVDALYDEFKTEMDEFNAMLKSQNRLLCYGFGFEKEDSYTQYFTLNTPYDLFTSDSYTGYDNNSMLWDCGPKWYLEILEDGSVVAPVNAVRQYPLSLAGYYTLYLGGVADAYINVLADGSDMLFPVSVSDDANTVTVNPYIYEDTEFYLNAMYSAYGYMYTPNNSKITSALTLTKGWTDEGATPASVKSAGNAAPQMIGIPSVDGSKAGSISPAKRKTSFKAMKKYGKAEYSIVTREQLEKNVKAFYEDKR